MVQHFQGLIDAELQVRLFLHVNVSRNEFCSIQIDLYQMHTPYLKSKFSGHGY